MHLLAYNLIRTVMVESAHQHDMHLQPVISADRRNIRLNLRVSDRKSPHTDTRAYVNTVPDGKMLLIEIGQRDGNEVGVPIITKVPYITKLFKNTGVRPAGRQFLLIRPRVIVQEEEEELLLNPPNANAGPLSRKSSRNTGAKKSVIGLAGTVTEQIIIQEEELLGIDQK